MVLPKAVVPVAGAVLPKTVVPPPVVLLPNAGAVEATAALPKAVVDELPNPEEDPKEGVVFWVPKEL